MHGIGRLRQNGAENRRMPDAEGDFGAVVGRVDRFVWLEVQPEFEKCDGVGEVVAKRPLADQCC